VTPSGQRPAGSEPTAGRPHMPGYGVSAADDGLLPWSWAVRRLERARNYWVATTGPDGTPHLTAVWGAWLDNAFHFSTGGRSRKARNLTADPRCAVTPEHAGESVVVEGTAERVTDPARLATLLEAYRRKYGAGFPDPDHNPVFAVRPRVAFGIVEHEAEFATAATRWLFPQAGGDAPST
jgi:PPOX class probable F420-dependent enzyme